MKFKELKIKFNEILKNLIIILSVIVITACSPNKEIISNDNQENKENKEIINTSANITIDSDNSRKSSNVDIDTEKQVHLHVQRLQKHNIIYFDLNKYDIHPDFSKILDDHADFLHSTPSYKITIEGHTDERGTPEYNIVLGERRANAVKMYLQSKGVSSEQISIVSFGKEKPAVLGHDEVAYAKNRRVILIY